jgi:hypothetical protein
LIYGVFLVSDSAQFSTIVTEVSAQNYVGTAVTLQQSLGYIFTIFGIIVIPLGLVSSISVLVARFFISSRRCSHFGSTVGEPGVEVGDVASVVWPTLWVVGNLSTSNDARRDGQDQSRQRLTIKNVRVISIKQLQCATKTRLRSRIR